MANKPAQVSNCHGAAFRGSSVDYGSKKTENWFCTSCNKPCTLVDPPVNRSKSTSADNAKLMPDGSIERLPAPDKGE